MKKNNKPVEKLLNHELAEVELIEKRLAGHERGTLKVGSVEHRVAKERLLYLLLEKQEQVAHALIRKALEGDVNAMREVLDRLYGKSKETIDFGGNVQFSLKALAQKREEMQGKFIEAVVQDKSSVVSHEELDRP